MQVFAIFTTTVTFNVKYVNKTLHFVLKLKIAGMAVESQRFDSSKEQNVEDLIAVAKLP